MLSCFEIIDQQDLCFLDRNLRAECDNEYLVQSQKRLKVKLSVMSNVMAMQMNIFGFIFLKVSNLLS